MSLCQGIVGCSSTTVVLELADLMATYPGLDWVYLMLLFKILKLTPGKRENPVISKYRIIPMDWITSLLAQESSALQFLLLECLYCDCRVPEIYTIYSMLPQAVSLRSAAAITVCGVAGELICRFFGHPTFSQEVEDPQEGLFLELLAHGICPVSAWILQVGTLDFFSFVLYSWGMRRWTSTNADTLSAIYGEPQTGRCHRQILLLLKCYSFYKHAKQRALSFPLFYHDCQKICRDDSFC